ESTIGAVRKRRYVAFRGVPAVPWLPRVGVPDDDVAVVRPRRQSVLARMTGQALSAVAMPGQPAELRSAPDLVDARLRRLGPVSCSQILPVRTEYRGFDKPGALESRKHLAGADVPNPGCMIIARSGDPFTIGAEAQVVQLLLVPAQGDWLPGAG